MDSVNNAKFNDLPLKLYEPDWGSSLAKTIVELERLRMKRLGGPVPPYIFFQLKEIFQMMESLGSVRIEGNNTTLAEFVEKIIERTSVKTEDEQLKEIFNIDKAIKFIEENVNSQTVFSRALISELHKIIVDGLTPPPAGEGSRMPGAYRSTSVSIVNSSHKPPEPIRVLGYMDGLIDFVNKPVDLQNDLLVTALAHHRLAWIHPFDNGNGRLIRMFTYALLVKQGFKVKDGRILNPTAIFCMDRNKYYDMLELADSGEQEKALQWCAYVLEGLKSEIEKIDHLLDLKYMTSTILLPMLSFALEREHITQQEYEILVAVVKNEDMILKSSNLTAVIGQESSVQRSRIIKRLRNKEMLKPIPGKSRVYTIGFANNYLLRGVFFVLKQNGFVPASLDKKNN
ncbi:MAG: cell filamentation protein Fic [Candidatus Kerfeldbacteria bacterium CG_4_10_14_0_8_um_filter_42_10]|uniref:Cell filamentation protein Fic n=1 Tax=Candidatus Kerfeldbacteria bacterium CG_4_10_14_0_8_um_filter_42_10 TaxID=2014248 RepID=A0A2M7RGY1_9BACT|nr:MAG: cell filamentation protein Fic [Candidatus Kerfeldbacteria bacterium CG_4_10_14_0_8_um_filter_42_10]